jgi:hypothetical protein
MERSMMYLVVLPEEEWNYFKSSQNEMLALLKNLGTDSKSSVTKNISGYITAKEFMEAVKIRRTKFDQLVQTNRIKTIKKLRKIYVPIAEVERYFKDSTIP